MSATQENEKMIFETALELKTDAERTTYLDKVCGFNLTLKARIMALLQARDGGGDYLETLMKDPGFSVEENLFEKPGTIIGRYKLLEKIGEGGMAVVYMAEQTEPIRRKVALKIIKLGMDTKSVIARFEAERQALAMMDHPNIAKVLDAGATETGRPYFVMELVTGVSITEYCDKNNLSTKERLALFIEVCNAVQHAHQKGIIHRDIKPTNVMVTLRDGQPIPKIIDFGIAKATNQRLTEKTLFTRYAHIIGTPAYMSPEQAELSDVDIDTRSDIYSLGVLLYELLTGTTPFSEEELRKAGYLEMQRVIREQEPAKPSTKLSTLGQTLTDVAKHRCATPDILRKAVRGDLDWIVMKSLEKARERRYDNASALAMDIQRHLDEQPILVRAPSTIYRLHKLLRRHRSWAAVSIIFIVLSSALLVTMMMWKQDRLQFAEDESVRHKKLLSQAWKSYIRGQYGAALNLIGPILHSKHIESEAQLLYDQILGAAREKVKYYTKKIQADPTDPNNYLRRAQQYYCLDDKEKIRADMDEYRTILNPPKGTAAYDDWLKALLSQESPSGFLFGIAENLGPPVNLPDPSDYEWLPRIHLGGLSITVYRNFDEEQERWIYTRPTKYDPWDAGIRKDTLPKELIKGGNIIPGWTTIDGLELYTWSSSREGYGEMDIYVRTRERLDTYFSEPVNIGSVVNTQYDEGLVTISGDGLELIFSDYSHPRPGGCGSEDLWVTRRATQSAPWQKPENLGPNVNSTAGDSRPHISADGLLLFFDSSRPGGYGEWDIYVSKRKTLLEPWEEAVNLGPRVNGPTSEFHPCISPDVRELFFVRSEDIWRVPIVTIEENTDLKNLTPSDRQLRKNDSREEVASQEI